MTDAPPLRARPNPYARPDYFTTDVSKGVTRTPSNARVCALTSDFLNGFRDAVIYETGKAYRRVLKSCGRRWGTQFMKRFDAEVSAHYKTPLAELGVAAVHTCLADAFNYHGYGKLSVGLDALDQGVVCVELRNSVMPALVAEADRPVDLLMAGVFGAVFSHLSGQDLDCVQTDCPSMGADASRFLVAAAPRVRELELWLAKALPHAAVPHEAALRRLLAPNPEANGQPHRPEVR